MSVNSFFLPLQVDGLTLSRKIGVRTPSVDAPSDSGPVNESCAGRLNSGAHR